MAHQDILIEAQNISRYYPGKTALANRTHSKHGFVAVDQLSIRLHRGEILGFLGANGAGKSTTMNMLTGNLAPSAGRITIAGVDLLDNPIEAKKHLGYLPDTPPLYNDLRVDEYLSYCAQLHRIPKSRQQQAVQYSKERCGLVDQGKRIIGHLSKGYQQRVGIAQAIIHEPDIVILDEPTSGLDPIQMIEIRQLIKELGAQHSVMLSSHILPEIQSLCHRIVILHQGKLCFNATCEQIQQQMQIPTLHLKTQQAVNIAQLQHDYPHLQWQQENHGFSVHYPGSSTDSPTWDSVPLAQELIQKALNDNWGLYEIYQEKRSLEDIFIQLTCGDPGLAQPVQEIITS